MRRSFTALAFAATLTACSESTDTPSGITALLHDQGLVGSATGVGTLDVTAPPPAIGEADFQFVAIQTGNQGAFGSFRMTRPRAGFLVDFSGEVTCLSFDPVNHRAWIGGVVRENRSTDPNHQLAIHQPGRDVWFRVVDNGDDSGAAPDRSSVYGFEGAAGVITSAEYCQRQLWTPGDVNAFALTKGVIQVRTR